MLENRKSEIRAILAFAVNINIRACDDAEVSLEIKDAFWPEVLHREVSPAPEQGMFGLEVSTRYHKGVWIRITRGDAVLINVQATQEQAIGYLKDIARAIILLSAEKVDEVTQAVAAGLHEGLEQVAKDKRPLRKFMGK